MDFFTSLFTSFDPYDTESCLGGMNSNVSTDMNSMLMRIFSKEEIKDVVFQMTPLSSPGLDDFSAQFYQFNRDIIGKEVCQFSLQVLNQGATLKKVNVTFITLISKIKEPKNIADYHPISLCNVIYKIVAKVLANMLKVVLPNIISRNQSAFGPNRHIYDNIMVAYERIHTLSSRLKGQAGYMALKLDMSKAFNRVE